MKALFITNPKDLFSEISGGVQICSSEFLEVVELISSECSIFNVSISKNWSLRLLRKLSLDSYCLYDFKKYEFQLFEIVEKKDIDTIFINKAELIRVSSCIKTKFGNKVKVIVLSHGNETGDFLHELTLPNKKKTFFSLLISKLRLGMNLYTESYYRHRFIDLVCAMSKEEEAIEKWLGAKETFYFPRLIANNKIDWSPKLARFGFVGTLNHTPNLIALEQICQRLSLEKDNTIELRIVGSGEKEGKYLESKYKFVTYLGRLDDNNLIKEASTWLYFLNPIFWYSRGASMKLGQALSWGIPVISTSAGARGYKFKKDFISYANNNAASFVQNMIKKSNDLLLAKRMFADLNSIHEYTYSKLEIAEDLKRLILKTKANG